MLTCFLNRVGSRLIERASIWSRDALMWVSFGRPAMIKFGYGLRVTPVFGGVHDVGVMV